MKQLMAQMCCWPGNDDVGMHFFLFIAPLVAFEQPQHIIALPSTIANPLTEKMIYAVNIETIV